VCILVAIAVASGVIAGCGGSGRSATSSTAASQARYPTPVEQNFIGSCEREAAAQTSQTTASKYCHAALTCVERRLPLTQFEQVERNAVTGRSNPKMSILLDCAKSSRRALG
jgi:hypothetical protein